MSVFFQVLPGIPSFDPSVLLSGGGCHTLKLFFLRTFVLQINIINNSPQAPCIRKEASINNFVFMSFAQSPIAGCTGTLTVV